MNDRQPFRKEHDTRTHTVSVKASHSCTLLSYHLYYVFFFYTQSLKYIQLSLKEESSKKRIIIITTAKQIP